MIGCISMADYLAELLRQAETEMVTGGLARSGSKLTSSAGFDAIRRVSLETTTDAADLLLKAAACGFFPECQPPGNLSDLARKDFLLRHMESRAYRVRNAR